MQNTLRSLLVAVFFFSAFSGNYAQSRLIINNGGYVVLNGGTSTTPLYFVIANSATNAITRNTNGHIISEGEYNIVQWNTRTTTGSYTFPIGRSTNIYTPVVFNKLTAGTESGGGTDTGKIRLSSWYTAANATWPTGTSLCGAATENDVSDRFWKLDVLSYSANPSADVDFYYDTVTPEIEAIAEADLQMQRWDVSIAAACKWATPPVGTVDATNNYANNYIRVSGISSFSPWAMVKKTSPLPVELLVFDAFPEDNKVVKTVWTTATEINNEYFAIERSKDGVNFEQIGTMQGAKNSSSVINYAYYDVHPYTGISYYRLRQVDFDGQYSYSEIKEVYIGTFEIISIYPNPGRDYIQYVVASDKGGEIKVHVVDVLGREVISENELIAGGTKLLRLSTSHLANGCYYLEVTSPTAEKRQRQFVIE